MIMLDPRLRLSFGAKTRPCCPIAILEQFERYISTEVRISRSVDHTHAPRADGAQVAKADG
jgi:hypothetical protein